MKNKIIYLVSLVVLGIVGLSGCKKDETSAGFTRITYYPTLDLSGDLKMYIPLNSTYVEPGYSSTLKGEDITSQVAVTSDVNTSEVGIYSINYVSAKNDDGFGATAKRQVVVYDPSNIVDPIMEDISGDYTSTINRTTPAASANKGPYTIKLTKLVDGLYIVDDFLGGWYWFGSGYGQSYGYDGIISVSSTGDVALRWSNPEAGWHDGATLTNSAYSTATHTFTWASNMNDVPTYIFNVTLVKK